MFWPPWDWRVLLRDAGVLNLLLIACWANPTLATERLPTNAPELQVSPSRYGPDGSVFELTWMAPPKIYGESDLTREPRFKSFIPEFPPEDFSFSLVEYSSMIRVVENDMLFRLEAPGVGRSLVSCEFIF